MCKRRSCHEGSLIMRDGVTVSQPMRRKLHRGLISCYVWNRGIERLNTFFSVVLALFQFRIWLRTRFGLHGPTDSPSLKVFLLGPEQSRFSNTSVRIRAEKKKTTRRKSCLVCPLLRLTTWSGEADSTNYRSQRLTDSWHPLADFLSQSPTLNAAQKNRSSGSIARSFNQWHPHPRQGSTARTLAGCSLIIFGVITVAVRRQTFKGSHLYSTLSTFPSPSLWASTPRGLRAGGRVGFLVCCSICLTHVTALIYAADERAGGNGHFPCALVCSREEIRFLSGWRSTTLDAKELLWSTAECVSYLNLTRPGVLNCGAGTSPLTLLLFESILAALFCVSLPAATWKIVLV